MNEYTDLRITLTLEQRLELDRIIGKTWYKYLPEYTPSGYHYRQRFIDYVKDFRRQYSKDPRNIKILPKKINFILDCYETSSRVRSRKLNESNYTDVLIKDCLKNV